MGPKAGEQADGCRLEWGGRLGHGMTDVGLEDPLGLLLQGPVQMLVEQSQDSHPQLAVGKSDPVAPAPSEGQGAHLLPCGLGAPAGVGRAPSETRVLVRRASQLATVAFVCVL